jgi:hypothetical protein
MFLSYIDPTVEHDLLSPTKPWALSPLISTMPHFMHTRVPNAADCCRSSYIPPFPPTQSIRDSTEDLYLTVIQGLDSSSSSISSRGFEGAGQRRSYFNSASRRELIQFGPEVSAVGHG